MRSSYCEKESPREELRLENQRHLNKIIYLYVYAKVFHLIQLLYFPSFRDLDARAKSERYRALFRLPKDEKLDGHTDCTLWTPFNKMHILGQMFVSTNYICFTSKEETLCSLIIPLREVGCFA